MKQLLFLAVLLAACGSPESTQTEVSAFSASPYEEHYPNGQLKIKGQNAKELRHGLWTAYYESGVKWSEEHYVDGERNGVSVSYYPSGIVRYRGMYRQDKRVGKWYFYHEDGKIATEMEMGQNGVPDQETN
jgi:antitoxin component YwqK of YwqJK toxin-antitoxin module